jgi:hypothetical protein
MTMHATSVPGGVWAAKGGNTIEGAAVS